MNFEVRIQRDDFDVSTELKNLLKQGAGDGLAASGAADIGAVANFVGFVRDSNQGDEVSRMTLEHYPGMTESSITHIIEEAFDRWPLQAATVIHRIGELMPGDQIVLVAVAGRHRGDSFAACEFIMDYLKTRAPFWKKELTSDGGRWVDARESDEVAAARWSR